MALNKQNVSKAQLQVLQARLGRLKAGVAYRANLNTEEQLVLTIDRRLTGSSVARCGMAMREFDSGAGFPSHRGDDAGHTSEVYVKGKVDETISARSIWTAGRIKS